MSASDFEALWIGLLLCGIVVAILFIRDAYKKFFGSEKVRQYFRREGRPLINGLLTLTCIICFLSSAKYPLAFPCFAILLMYLTFAVGPDKSHQKLAQASILNEIATALRQGIPLSSFVAALAGDYADEISARLKLLGEGLAQGRTLSNALQDAQLVPMHTVLAVRAGESCGGHAIPHVLQRAADELKAQSTLRASYMFWFYYSACMTAVCGGLMLFQSIFIFPKFREIFKAMRLPLVGMTLDSAINWIFSNLSGPLCLLFIACFLLMCDPRISKRVWLAFDRAIAAIPILSRQLRHRALARSARVMEALATAGLPLPTICRSVAVPEISGAYSDSFAMLSDKTNAGQSLAEVLPQTQLPDSFSWFAKAGASGNFIIAMRAAAEYHDAKAKQYDRILATLLPCVVMLTGGLVVGSFYIVVLLNCLKIHEAIRSK